jgi:hypothetical protein
MNKIVWFVIIVISILLYMQVYNYYFTKEHFTNKDEEDEIEDTDLVCNKKICDNYVIKNFKNKSLEEIYLSLVQRYGYPSNIKDKINGFVEWNRVDFIKKLVLLDKKEDFLKTYFKLFIPKHLIKEVLSICPSIVYNKKLNEVCIIGESINRNIAVLYSILLFINNPTSMTLVDAKKNLNRNIIKTRKTWNHNIMYDEVQNLMKNHYNKYSDKFRRERYTLL